MYHTQTMKRTLWYRAQHTQGCTVQCTTVHRGQGRLQRWNCVWSTDVGFGLNPITLWLREGVKKNRLFLGKSPMGGWGSRFLNLWKCENTRFFLLKHPEMLWNMWYYHLKWRVISDHFLMLWFQKDSLNTVGFRTYGGGSRVLKQNVTFWVLNVPMGGRWFRSKSYKL